MRRLSSCCSSVRCSRAPPFQQRVFHQHRRGDAARRLGVFQRVARLGGARLQRAVERHHQRVAADDDFLAALERPEARHAMTVDPGAEQAALVLQEHLLVVQQELRVLARHVPSRQHDLAGRVLADLEFARVEHDLAQRLLGRIDENLVHARRRLQGAWNWP
jgi:hypothetical protein